MANERQIKRRISVAQNISKITKAMEMVAASKMKKAQEQALAARPYAQALYDSIITISKAAKLDSHPLLSAHDEGIPMAVVIGTDKGLCGALNANLAKKLLAWKNEHRNGEVVAIGKKAVLFSRGLGMTVHAQFTDFPEHVSFKDIIPVIALVLDGFTNRRFRSVDILHTDFINTLSQKPKQSALLPLSQVIKPDIVEEKTESSDEAKKQYVFEPSPRQILSYLLPFYLENTLFHSFLEAKASEHSARMVAMKNASENAGELVEELKLIYNKTRQQGITSELLDIISATMALN
jgi:F-type H+-transporting ATPase subunit gamma